MKPEFPNSTERMVKSRAQRREQGMSQISVWITAEQKELLDRIAKGMDGTLSDAAQALIFKNTKQLMALGLFHEQR